ncbi:TetR/AcrR family transcriptional regulator [Pseudonocardia lutea]|uniref:TetR/AcrR family transcriptional regulator n=1 Tax=Pseudonocardia lutea TaxID=2172015 RepID=A0ABW1I9V5_9PSEU
MARSRTVHDGERTRDALIDAAAELFAEHGVDAVSVRSINKAAGVAPAAVHYHFGSRDGLLQAVLVRDGDAVLRRVAELARVLAARPTVPTARELVLCVARPYLELLQREPVRGRHWLRVVAQLTLSDDERLERTASEASALLLAQVRRRFGDGSDPVLRWALAVTTLVQMLGGPLAHDDDQVEALLNFVCGGLEAADRRRGRVAVVGD